MFCRLFCLFAIASFSGSSFLFAQSLPTVQVPSNVEYQYQLHYERPFRGWPGPGLSLGGSLPANGREGFSSFYGLPFPVPLGAGVYVNPFSYSSRLPGGMSFGLMTSVDSPRMNSQRPERPLLLSRQHNEMSVSGLLEDRPAQTHLRRGFSATALKQYPEAIREFKHALKLNPSLIQAGETRAKIFGPENPTNPTTMLKQVAGWVREDLSQPDRLFLLGFLLKYNEDPRSTEILAAAVRLKGPQNHFLALMDLPVSRLERGQPPQIPPSPSSPESQELPELHSVPVALQAAHLFTSRP